MHSILIVIIPRIHYIEIIEKDALKKIQSEVRCALHFPSDAQLQGGTCLTDESQKTGLKVDLDELNGQISYELGTLYFLQHKWTEAAAAFAITRQANCVT